MGMKPWSPDTRDVPVSVLSPQVPGLQLSLGKGACPPPPPPLPKASRLHPRPRALAPASHPHSELRVCTWSPLLSELRVCTCTQDGGPGRAAPLVALSNPSPRLVLEVKAQANLTTERSMQPGET